MSKRCEMKFMRWEQPKRRKAIKGAPYPDRRASNDAVPLWGAVQARAALALVIAICFLLEAQAVARAVPAGEVIAFQGQCFTVSSARPTPLLLGTTVNIGDEVRVPADARLKLRMSDGSIISVASGSEIIIRD